MTPQPRTLILPTSRTPPDARPAIAAGGMPRIDYLDLAETVGAGAAIVDWAIYDRAPWRLIERLDRVQRLAWGQALYTLRHAPGAEVVVSLGEDVGLPLAWLLRRRGRAPRHILVSHQIAGFAKGLQIRLLGGLGGFHRVVTMTSTRRAEIVDHYRLDPDRIVFLPHAVDEQFWNLDRCSPEAPPAGPPLLLSVGQSKRDYHTLLQAAGGLNALVRIQQSSAWYVGYTEHVGETPPNVELGGRLSWAELRQGYARCRAVVVPLAAHAHAGAGTTTILEAMAMARPVVVAVDANISDYVRHGETGLIVPSGDVHGLRAAIDRLLADPAEAARMGEAGRRHLIANLGYNDRIRQLAALTDDRPSLPP